MKKTLLLLAMVGLMGSVTAQAGAFDAQLTTQPVHKTASSARPIRRISYITTVAATGSHIPLVVTRYGDDVHANSSFVALGKAQLDQTGQLNVGGQLTQHDPAISSFGLRH